MPVKKKWWIIDTKKKRMQGILFLFLFWVFSSFLVTAIVISVAILLGTIQSKFNIFISSQGIELNKELVLFVLKAWAVRLAFIIFFFSIFIIIFNLKYKINSVK